MYKDRTIYPVLAGQLENQGCVEGKGSSTEFRLVPFDHPVDGSAVAGAESFDRVSDAVSTTRISCAVGQDVALHVFLN